MNIRCPSCQTVFRVDPARIPPKGIRARCARCGETFQVRHPDESGGTATTAPASPPTPASAAAAPNVAAPSPTPPPSAASTPSMPSTPSAPNTPGEPTAASGSGAPSTRAASTAATAAPSAAPGAPHTFGSRDPNARAQRIARALVSDIIAYHPKRWESAREGGTLRGEFRDEIMKSWEEYVAQVGLELAKSTPHFRTALNDILARGQQIF